ncbi:hypothetical protein COCMIDRAFT_40177 [Bipolaris oryzae ATCC 44560]|uniref:Steroid 5-alpha reductase C-terminal domain-containing protein n=1 Tax=Bipolaris oryzae ATCC 44560 TaxID=930090 RepID=W6YQI7_COCMI|nr:uncharacterized protein COCMIDRAFT_40177 [Bipolaris oryzae ATCC 44560]EUC41677.1 hypothetical protein COCMIDRAFT_40177 [Bipolaris oryzae ATCC 44560]
MTLDLNVDAYTGQQQRDKTTGVKKCDRQALETLRSEASKKKDLVPRGDYRPSPAGKLTFFVLRSLEPAPQCSILAHGFGTSVLTSRLINGLGLSPYRLVLLTMSVGSVVKQNIWVTILSRGSMTVGVAVAIAMLNAASNSLSTYAFPALPIGGTLHVVGILTELITEIQRERFKADPNNKGKVCTGGLWGLARHINYGGYTMWRAGYAMAGGGYGLGALRAIPVLSEYCEKWYGAQWEAYRQKTPYELIPYVY